MNLTLLAPEIALLIAVFAVILFDAFSSNKKLLPSVSLVGLAISAAFSIYLWGGAPQVAFGGTLSIDAYSLFFKIFFDVIAALVILASADYVGRFAHFQGEYHALVLLAALGMELMAATSNLIAIYLALETASIAFYALVGFLKDKKSTESALKYLLLSATASAVFVYGLSFVFGYTGAVNLPDISASIHSQILTQNVSPGLLLGVVLTLAGLGFKMAAFHFQF